MAGRRRWAVWGVLTGLLVGLAAGTSYVEFHYTDGLCTTQTGEVTIWDVDIEDCAIVTLGADNSFVAYRKFFCTDTAGTHVFMNEFSAPGCTGVVTRSVQVTDIWENLTTNNCYSLDGQYSKFDGGSWPAASQCIHAVIAGFDPITSYRGVQRQFWLPVGKLHSILRTRELSLLASTFPGSGSDQWFGRVVVTSPGGIAYADIAVRDLGGANRSGAPPGRAARAFETLDVVFGGERLVDLPAPDKLFNRRGVHFSFLRMREMAQRPVIRQFTIAGAQRDVVMVATSSLQLFITASPAADFYGFRPDLAVEYAHLDIVIVEMRNKASFRGLLPELWGLRPMSNRTRACLEPPGVDFPPPAA